MDVGKKRICGNHPDAQPDRAFKATCRCMVSL